MWDTFNSLFQHLEDEKEARKKVQSHRNSTPVRVIDAAHGKLAKYYGQTTHELGDFFNFGNILNPNCNTTTYDGKDWDPELDAKYRANFLNAYERRYAPQV